VRLQWSIHATVAPFAQEVLNVTSRRPKRSVRSLRVRRRARLPHRTQQPPARARDARVIE
jgi:hypothetical protein